MSPVTHRYGQTVAVVGAGAAGALVTIQLLRRSTRPGHGRRPPHRPLPLTGRGVAYGTTDLSHVLNVPAARMSAFPDRPDHFVGWLADAPPD